MRPDTGPQPVRGPVSGPGGAALRPPGRLPPRRLGRRWVVLVGQPPVAGVPLMAGSRSRAEFGVRGDPRIRVVTTPGRVEKTRTLPALFPYFFRPRITARRGRRWWPLAPGREVRPPRDALDGPAPLE